MERNYTIRYIKNFLCIKDSKCIKNECCNGSELASSNENIKITAIIHSQASLREFTYSYALIYWDKKWVKKFGGWWASSDVIHEKLVSRICRIINFCSFMHLFLRKSGVDCLLITRVHMHRGWQQIIWEECEHYLSEHVWMPHICLGNPHEESEFQQYVWEIITSILQPRNHE
jgi:hypothetical protein